MAGEWAETLVTTANKLSLIPKTHTIERENHLLKVVL